MVQRLAGIGDEIAGPLGSLVDTIGQLLNPDAKFQQEMKMAFMQKPELMQKFVDVEKANPGTLAAFGFGDDGTNLLKNMHESIPALIARRQAPAIAAELQKPNSAAARSGVTQAVSGQTPGQLAADDLSSWMASEGMKLFKDNPEMALQVMDAKFGSRSTPRAKAEDAAAIPIVGAKAADAQATLDAMGAAKSVRNLPPMDQVEMVVSGELTGDQVAGILTGPHKQGFDAAMELYKQERALTVQQLSARYMGLSGSGANADPLARARQTAAVDAWKAHQGAGTVQDWYNQLWPGHKDEIGVSSPNGAGVIAEAMKNAQFAKRTDQVTKMMNTIETDIKSITEAKIAPTPTMVNTRIANINSVLKANSSDWEAVAMPPGGFFDRIFTEATGRWRVMYKDKAGNITADPGALVSNVPPMDMINAKQAARASLTPQQSALADMLEKATGEARKTIINQLRARDSSIADRIISAAGGEKP